MDLYGTKMSYALTVCRKCVHLAEVCMDKKNNEDASLSTI